MDTEQRRREITQRLNELNEAYSSENIFDRQEIEREYKALLEELNKLLPEGIRDSPIHLRTNARERRLLRALQHSMPSPKQEAAQDTGRPDKAVSPTCFNT